MANKSPSGDDEASSGSLQGTLMLKCIRLNLEMISITPLAGSQVELTKISGLEELNDWPQLG